MVSQVREFNNIPEAIVSFQQAKVEYLERLGGAMVRQIDMGFESGEDALGRPWEPLQSADGDILIETGEMRNSIEYQVDEDNLNVAVGGDVEYLRHHEFGTGDLPERPILRPAMTWAEKNLIDPMADDVIGEAFDMHTRSGL